MKRIGSFILALFLLISSLSVTLHADDLDDPDVDLGVGFGKFFENYGYEYLATLENGEDLQELYDKIDTKAILFDLGYTSELGEGNTLVTVSYSTYGISGDDARKVWEIYKDDHPLYYWLDPEASITESKISIAVEADLVTKTVRSQYTKDINAALEEIITSTNGVYSAYSIVLAYHDTLIERMDLAYEGDGVMPSAEHISNTILGAFSTGKGTSTAYAKALQLLLDYSEIESVLVNGTRDGIPHTWNIVKLDDGKWYWCDLTLDEEDLDATAFCLTEEEFFALPYEYEYYLPTGVGDTYLYELPERAESAYSGDELKIGDTFTVDGFTYAVSGYNKVKLVGVSLKSGDVTIPASVTGLNADHKVTSIGTLATENCDGVTSVTLPASIARVFGDAFTGMRGLKKIYFDGDAPKMHGADSDMPSFDADKIVLYADPAKSGWFDSEHYDAGAKTWMGYRIKKLGVSEGVAVCGQILSYDCKNEAVVTLVQVGEVMYETTLDASGIDGQNTRVFTLEDVEDGVYDLVIKVDGHLQFTVTGITVDGADVDLRESEKAEIATMTLISGDANGDGCVDLKDVTLLTSSNTYGKTYDEAAAKSADINGDKCFDLKDLTIITSDKNYGKSDVVIEY